MSSSFSRNIARALSETERITGSQTFRWKNTDIACTCSSLQRGMVIEIGGNPYEVQLSLYVRLENFLTTDDTVTVTTDSDLITTDNDLPVPFTLQGIEFRGKPYLIVSATQAGPQSHVVLHLADPNSGRK